MGNFTTKLGIPPDFFGDALGNTPRADRRGAIQPGCPEPRRALASTTDPTAPPAIERPRKTMRPQFAVAATGRFPVSNRFAALAADTGVAPAPTARGLPAGRAVLPSPVQLRPTRRRDLRQAAKHADDAPTPHPAKTCDRWPNMTPAALERPRKTARLPCVAVNTWTFPVSNRFAALSEDSDPNCAANPRKLPARRPMPASAPKRQPGAVRRRRKRYRASAACPVRQLAIAASVDCPATSAPLPAYSATFAGGGPATPACARLAVGPPAWAGGHRFSIGAQPALAFPVDSSVGWADGSANNCLIHSIAQQLAGARRQPGDFQDTAQCAAVRAALVEKYDCHRADMLALHDWWHLILAELGVDPGDYHIVCWTANGEEAESVGPGATAILLQHSPGHFAPLWVPTEDPSPAGETPLARAKRLARNRKRRDRFRAAGESAENRKRAIDKARSKQRRLAGTHEKGVAARSQKRRAGGNHEPRVAQRSTKRQAAGTHEPAVAQRSEKRRAAGTHEPRVSARSQKRRAAGTHEPRVSARSQKRRAAGTHEPRVSARSQKRRAAGTHEPGVTQRSKRRRAAGTHEPGAAQRSEKRRAGGVHEKAPTLARALRAALRPASAPASSERGWEEQPLYSACERSGVAHIAPTRDETPLGQAARHARMRILVQRYERSASWQLPLGLEGRAAAVGVDVQSVTEGSEVRALRAAESKYLRAHRALPLPPVAIPADTPAAVAAGLKQAFLFERELERFALRKCSVCLEVRLNMQVVREGSALQTCLRCNRDKRGLFGDPNAMLPHWRDAGGGLRYAVPPELSSLTLAEKLLIARLSVAVTIHHLDHGGIASTGHIATFPKPVEPLATVLPRLPSAVSIIRVRRKGARRKRGPSSIYSVRKAKILDALSWLKAHNKFYADVQIDMSRLGDLADGGEIPGVVNLDAGAQGDIDKGPAPAQNAPHASQADCGLGGLCETGGMLMAQNVTDVQAETERLLQSAREQCAGNSASAVEFSWPVAGGAPVSEFQTRGFFCLAFPWLFPGGVGCFFDDRQFGEGVTFGAWVEHLLYYFDGRFCADTAFSFVALNMAYRRRAAEQASRFLQSHIEFPPESVAEIQDRLLAGDESFLRRLRHFGGGVLRGTDAYWAQRADDVDAWLNFHVHAGNGVPTLFLTGSCAEFQWPELLDLLEDQIYAGSGEAVDLRTDGARRFRAAQEYSLIVQQFFQQRLDRYIALVLRPAFNIAHYWFRYEFAKSRGQIHFHMFAIRLDREPHCLYHDLQGGHPTAIAATFADWAWESLTLTAMHPAIAQDGSYDPAQVRKPEGTWEPVRGDSAAQLRLQSAPSFARHHAACVNSYAHHECSAYCMRAPRGKKRAVEGAGGVRRECRMGAGVEATAGRCDTPGFLLRDHPQITADPRGFEKLDLPRSTCRLQQHSALHAVAWKANGDVSTLLLKSDPDSPDPDEIARVLKYVLAYGCKGVEQPEIQKQLFRDSVMRADENCAAKTMCARLLNATVARRMISKAECMVEAANMDLWGCSERFERVSLSGFRKLELSGTTGSVRTIIDRYRARDRALQNVTLFEFVSRELGRVPVFTGGHTRPVWPPTDPFARTMLLIHKPWRDAVDLRPDTDAAWAEAFLAFVDSAHCPLILQVAVARAKDWHARAQATQEEPPNAAQRSDVETDEDDPAGLYDPPVDVAGDTFSADFDFGAAFDWSAMPHGLTAGSQCDAGDASAWLDLRVREFREAASLEGASLQQLDPMQANEEQRLAISLVLSALRSWIERDPKYRPLRLITAGVAGTGKSFLIRILTSAIRRIFGRESAVRVFAPTGVAAFQIGGQTAHRLFKIPTCGRAHGQLEPPTGESLRSLQENLRGTLALFGDERGMVGRTMLGWQEFHASCAPLAPNARRAAASWGCRPVVNLLGDDLQLPPVLDCAPYNRSNRGPASNHGLSTHDEFTTAVVLRELVRQGPDDAQLRGVLTRLRTYELTEDDADWLMALQVDKQPHRAWVEANGLYLYATHKEEAARNMAKLKETNALGAPVATLRARNSGAHARQSTSDSAGGLLNSLQLCAGARFMLTSGLCQEWGLYNGAIGEVVAIVYMPNERPPANLPAVVFVEFPGYCGPAFNEKRPLLVPIAPIERQCDCACRPKCARTMIPGRLAWGVTFHKSQGLTVGPGCPAECVVVHPPPPAFEKRNPGGFYVACSRAKTAGRGTYGEPGFTPSALYLQPLASRERLHTKVDNEITRGRNAMTSRIEKLAARTKRKHAKALAAFPGLVAWSNTQLSPQAARELMGPD